MNRNYTAPFLCFALMTLAAALVVLSDSNPGNRFDSQGKRHGVWRIYANSEFNETCSRKDEVCATVIYEHGVPVRGMYFNRIGTPLWNGKLISVRPFIPADGKHKIISADLRYINE